MTDSAVSNSYSPALCYHLVGRDVKEPVGAWCMGTYIVPNIAKSRVQSFREGMDCSFSVVLTECSKILAC